MKRILHTSEIFAFISFDKRYDIQGNNTEYTSSCSSKEYLYKHKTRNKSALTNWLFFDMLRNYDSHYRVLLECIDQFVFVVQLYRKKYSILMGTKFLPLITKMLINVYT